MTTPTLSTEVLAQEEVQKYKERVEKALTKKTSDKILY